MFKTQKLGKTERVSFSKIEEVLPLPNLLEIQKSSYEWFLKEGIREVFNDIYPIANYGGNISLKFIDYEFGEPKYSISECKYREVNYCAPLKAKMELDARKDKENMPDSVYSKELSKLKSGDLPSGKIQTMTIIIKATDSSSYKNVVDALDEMQICSIGKYVIDKINDQDQKLLDEKGVK